MIEPYDLGAEWVGIAFPEEHIRMIEDRDDMALIERVAGLKRGHHKHPYMVSKDALEAVFRPTGRSIPWRDWHGAKALTR